MRIFHNKIVLGALLILFQWVPVSAQSPVTVKLDRALYPKDNFAGMSGGISLLKSMGDSTFHIIGGDYSDTDVEFTIGLWDKNNNNSFADYMTDEFVMTAYKTDSIPVNFLFQRTNPVNYYKTCIIQIGGKEYQAKINPGGHSVDITKVLGNYLKPDITFFDRLPEKKFVNVYGDTVSLSSFEHKGKYIYVDLWETSCEKCLQIKDTLKKLNAQYGSVLTLVSLDYRDHDSAKVRNVVSRNHYDWEQGFTDAGLRGEIITGTSPFSRSSYSYGVLFNENGKVVKIFDEESPKLLEATMMEKLNKGK